MISLGELLYWGGQIVCYGLITICAVWSLVIVFQQYELIGAIAYVVLIPITYWGFPLFWGFTESDWTLTLLGVVGPFLALQFTRFGRAILWRHRKKILQTQLSPSEFDSYSREIIDRESTLFHENMAITDDCLWLLFAQNEGTTIDIGNIEEHIMEIRGKAFSIDKYSVRSRVALAMAKLKGQG